MIARTRLSAERFAQRHGATVADGVESAVAAADIVITATPSRTALVHHVQEGTHIVAVGADTPGKQELDPGLMERAGLVVVDDEDLARHAGILQNAERPVHLLSDVVHGHIARRDPSQVTVCGLSGLGIQDAAIASVVLARLNTINRSTDQQC